MYSMHQRQTATAQAAQQKRQQTPLAALWLILAAIFAHALLPVGSPMDRTFGSAFSATTFDVSLAPRGEASTLLVQQETGSSAGLGGPDPALSPAAVLPTSGALSAFARAPAPASPAAPELRSPPARSKPYAPRAPPLS